MTFLAGEHLANLCKVGIRFAYPRQQPWSADPLHT
jgi:hypothetical protein